MVAICYSGSTPLKIEPEQDYTLLGFFNLYLKQGRNGPLEVDYKILKLLQLDRSTRSACILQK